MKNVIRWIWKQGIVSTFVTGFFALLPIAITIGIMIWLGNLIHSWISAESSIGQFLERIGLQFVTKEESAYLMGLILVLVFIWGVGVLLKYVALHQLERGIESIFSRIPIFGDVFRPVSQVVSMFKKDQETEMKGMSVVYCEFGQNGGGGFLALLASNKTYRFQSQDCYVVYLPTSPLPMTGAIVFVPKENIHKIDMNLDDLMQIYFSMGIMSEKVVDKKYMPV